MCTNKLRRTHASGRYESVFFQVTIVFHPSSEQRMVMLTATAEATRYSMALTAYRNHHTDRMDGGILGSVLVFLSALCSSKPRDGHMAGPPRASSPLRNGRSSVSIDSSGMVGPMKERRDGVSPKITPALPMLALMVSVVKFRMQSAWWAIASPVFGARPSRYMVRVALQSTVEALLNCGPYAPYHCSNFWVGSFAALVLETINDQASSVCRKALKMYMIASRVRCRKSMNRVDL